MATERIEERRSTTVMRRSKLPLYGRVWDGDDKTARREERD
jgi:hypothetical protein